MMKPDYEGLLIELNQLIEKNEDDVLLKICQFLKEQVYHYDWVGFYIFKNDQLELGPYIGKHTDHTQIAIGKGVCGQVAESGKTIVVQDVSQEDNYIACSLDVQSEIVVPVLKEGKFIAELDIDSHSPAPFTNEDIKFLEKICNSIIHLF
ncbi:GAF domain-containing protein [Sunxiuqinia sp. A32]|uniref:GAF domain-containing protein n=1 Tax=Sunxiuqinia sp. A32 TaxID=3461496 RepID=UPI0040452330